MILPLAPRVGPELGCSERERFDRLFGAHHEALVGYLSRRYRDGGFVEDVVAETFLRVLERGPGWPEDDPRTRAWILRVATNEANRWLRRKRVRRRAQAELARAASACAGDGADDRAERSPLELARLLLETLPLHEQEALTLHHACGLSVEHVATVLGVAPGTVRSRLSRGRRRAEQTARQLGLEAES